MCVIIMFVCVCVCLHSFTRLIVLVHPQLPACLSTHAFNVSLCNLLCWWYKCLDKCVERGPLQTPPGEPCCHLSAMSLTQLKDTRIYSTAPHDQVIIIQPVTNFRLWLEVHAYSNPGACTLCIFECVTDPCFTPMSSLSFSLLI